MGPSIVIPLVVVPLLLLAGFVWYRRSMAALAPPETPPISGLRLTAESLHRLSSPPWRVVYEIDGTLGDVDHVLIGPPGVIAVTTTVADRPDPDQLRATRGDAVLVSEAAIARGPIDELLRPIQVSCRASAKVYWGRSEPERAAFDDVVHASQLVEGQRIAQWIAAMESSTDAPLDQTVIDTTWRHVVLGIGRPDPLP